MSEKLCLKWNDFQGNLKSAFESLRGDDDFSDVTLASTDGQSLQAHQVILAASSPFLANLMKRNKHPLHPIIYLRGVNIDTLTAILDFLYFGGANVYQDDLDSFLAIAEEFQLKGLMGGTDDAGGVESETKQNQVKTENCRMVETKVQTNRLFDRSEGVSNTDLKQSEQVVAIQTQFGDGLQDLEQKVKSMMTKSLNLLPNGHRQWECKVCGKEGHGSQIVKHIEANHLEGVVVPCKYCEKTFRSRNSIGHHRLRFHK